MGNMGKDNSLQEDERSLNKGTEQDGDERNISNGFDLSASSCRTEVCVTTLQGVKAAINARVSRIELCSALSEGGLTPSYALIKKAVQLCRNKVRVHVLIRPRAGDFIYDDDEIEMMLADIEKAGELGVMGVVIGALNPDGTINESFVDNAVRKAAKWQMSVTFSRAFDMCRDLKEAAYELSDLGVNYILTSGGEATAYEGARTLAQLKSLPSLNLEFIAASGINSDNIASIVDMTGLLNYHMSAKDVVKSKMTFINPKVHMGLPGADEYSNPCTNEEELRKIVAELNCDFLTDLQKRISELLPEENSSTVYNQTLDAMNILQMFNQINDELNKGRDTSNKKN